MKAQNSARRKNFCTSDVNYTRDIIIRDQKSTHIYRKLVVIILYTQITTKETGRQGKI